MKKKVRKITAAILAIVAVFAMSCVAFAANATQGGGVISSDNTITFVKEIAVFNPISHSVNYPGVTFTYAIAPANPAGATITDSDGDVAVVKQGVAAGVSMTDASAIIPAGSITANPNGAIISDTATVTIDPTAFDGAGIYRYAITETTPADFATKGFEAATDATRTTRYLDVYIVNGTSGLEVGGYVMYAGAANTSITSADESAKTDGFSGTATGATPNYATDSAIDKYKTYNITVSKTVTGDLGDKSNAFPFHASISGAPTASAITVQTEITSAAGTGTQKANLTLASGSVAKTNIADLKHGGSVLISGIPVSANVSISETNNTPDTYAVTTTGLTANLSDTAIAAGTDTTASAAVHAANVVNANDAVVSAAVGFTNHLESVSPTGIVLRYGAFIGIFAAAVVCAVLLMVKRRRSEQ